MNYKKCLIEAYKSGIKGWKLYKAINENKQCIPMTPLGECEELTVKEVFLQGSCDAMIMAWNLVDVIIDGAEVPRMLFVDDILEILKTVNELLISITKDETIEKTNRTEYKPSKCKLMYMNCTSNEQIKMSGVVLDVVKDHVYLGSIISEKGRKKDLEQRIIDCRGQWRRAKVGW